MKTIQLTPSELEMIKINREKAELAAKEAAVKKQAQLEKDIVGRKEYMQKTMKMDAEQVEAAQDFCKELGAGYKLEIATCGEDVKVTGDYLNPEDPASDDYRREIVWQDAFNRQSAKIVYKGYSIRVEEHVVFAAWSSRGTSKGYKMYISGPGLSYKDESRAYTKASTVKEKIKNAIEDVESENKLKEAQKSAITVASKKMKALYPDAIVEVTKVGERLYNNKYTEIDVMIVALPNGIKVEYRIYNDGSIARRKVGFPAKQDEFSLLNSLNTLKF